LIDLSAIRQQQALESIVGCDMQENAVDYGRADVDGGSAGAISQEGRWEKLP